MQTFSSNDKHIEFTPGLALVKVMKKFFEYLQKNNIIAIFLIIVLCSIIFIITENVEFQSQTVTYLNLTALGVIAVILYYATRKRHIKWRYIICISLGLFIFNRYYDKTVFLQKFHFELLYFLIIIGVVIVCAIIYPFIKELFIRISEVLEVWAKNRAEEDEQRIDKKEERRNRSKEKFANRQIRNGKGTDDEKSESEILLKLEESVELEESKEIEYNVGVEQYQTPDDNIQAIQKSVENRRAYTILFIIIFIILFGLSVGLMYFFYSPNVSDIIKKITSENLLTVILSILGTFMIFVFTVGMIVSLLIKWAQIIIEIVTKQHKGEMYFVFACSLLLVSQYILNNYSYTTDDLTNLLLDGKLFTFPLILSILVPVFLIFAENIVSFTTSNQELNDALKDCTKQTIQIAKGIVKSLLTFIEFVTSDYLSSIIEITKEDEINNDQENDDPDKREGDSGHIE